MRVDGKFHVGNDIPEGQGSVNTLLAECFEIQYELKVQAEEESSEWWSRSSSRISAHRLLGYFSAALVTMIEYGDREYDLSKDQAKKPLWIIVFSLSRYISFYDPTLTDCIRPIHCILRMRNHSAHLLITYRSLKFDNDNHSGCYHDNSIRSVPQNNKSASARQSVTVPCTG